MFKIIILTIALSSWSVTAGTANTCKSSNYCQTCTIAVCSQGYTYAAGKTLLPRMCTGTTKCTTKRTSAQLVTNCKTYNSYYGSSATTAKLQSNNACIACKSGNTYMNTKFASAILDITSVCASTASGSGCTAMVATCALTECWSINAGGAYAASCKQCNSGLQPSTTSIASQYGAGNTCATGTINSCLIYVSYKSDVSTTPTVPHCYTCATGYAVSSTSQGACVAYTTDTNCRIMKTSTVYCNTCNDNYHFGGNKCVLASNLIGFALIALAALFFN